MAEHRTPLHPGGLRATEATGRLLHPAGGGARDRPLGTEALRAIVDGLAEVVPPPDERPEEDTVARRRIIATDAYDVWLVDLGPRAVLAPHDHDGALGVLRVVAGHLVELAVDGAGASRSRVRQLATGDTTVAGPLDRHALVNATRCTATMLQAFSPPLGHGTAADDHGPAA